MYKNYTKEEIKQFEKELNDFCEKNQIELSAKMDLVVTCRKLGFSMYSLSLPENVDGIIWIDKGVKKIGISNLLPENQSRLVIAHELSHYIRKLNEHERKKSKLFVALKDNIFHDDNKSDLENEMDYMAAAILVPMNSFIKMMNSLGIKIVLELDEARKEENNKIELLAAYYGVEKELIYRRIIEACKYAA
jgi:Zn-dependent peptidase ImmA (M78 family)